MKTIIIKVRPASYADYLKVLKELQDFDCELSEIEDLILEEENKILGSEE